MTMAQKKELEEKLAIPELMLSIDEGKAILIFKQRNKLHSLSLIKGLTAKPRGKDREIELKAILEKYNG